MCCEQLQKLITNSEELRFEELQFLLIIQLLQFITFIFFIASSLALLAFILSFCLLVFTPPYKEENLCQ